MLSSVLETKEYKFIMFADSKLKQNLYGLFGEADCGIFKGYS